MDNNNIGQGEWKKSTVARNATLKDAAECLSKTSLQICLVVDAEDKLIGTLNDGDIRRGLIRGLSLSSKINQIVNYNPIVAKSGTPIQYIRQLMLANKVQAIPALDSENRVSTLHIWSEIESPQSNNSSIVIMAGGKGTRMRPYTKNCPKPMLTVQGKPILAHIIERAVNEGFKHVVLPIHYLGDKIKEYFGDGERFGAKIDYINEDLPLGTAGALSLLGTMINKPFIVTNGDVLTDINYLNLLDFHCAQKSDATMAVRIHEWQNPYGVVQTEGLKIVGFEEKPIVSNFINSGVYALSPSVLQHLSPNQACDMPSLFMRLQAKSMTTIVYPMHEPWLDVGRPEDLLSAQDLFAQNEFKPQEYRTM